MSGDPSPFSGDCSGDGARHRSKFPHGTRACYVRGCRCEECRAATTAAASERAAAVRAAAAELAPAGAPAPPVARAWTAPDGSVRTRVYQRACPGIESQPCPGRRYVREDSTGGICGGCRDRLSWNGLVDAAPARRHMAKLSRRGVGYKSVQAASDVGKTTILGIVTGRKRRIRKRTSDRILAVDAGAVADHGLVPAARTWQMLRELEAEYFTRAEVARQLGYKVPALQIGRRKVLARTEQRVERLYRRAVGWHSPNQDGPQRQGDRLARLDSARSDPASQDRSGREIARQPVVE